MDKIDIERLIDNSVNDSRGGYRPDEVKALMAKAYDAGISNGKELAKKALRKL